MATCKQGKNVSVAVFKIGRQGRGKKEAGQLRSNGKFCQASRKVVCKLVKPKPKQRCKTSTTRRKTKKR
tara:strand:+ start:2496 stop:2702 length:207 start_codon:yes stop_codon:yes gene_type:complete